MCSLFTYISSCSPSKKIQQKKKTIQLMLEPIKWLLHFSVHSKKERISCNAFHSINSCWDLKNLNFTHHFLESCRIFFRWSYFCPMFLFIDLIFTLKISKSWTLSYFRMFCSESFKIISAKNNEICAGYMFLYKELLLSGC